jgi:hypothetical protein
VSLTISEPGRNRYSSLDNNITIRHDAQLYGSTASDAHFDLAKSWLQRCKADHLTCRDGHYIVESSVVDRDQVLPTRLLDLTSLYAEDGKIRLCKTQDLSEVPQYVALSHCWGTVKPFLLTDATENTLFQGVRCSEFPATFTDAILISRKLGFQFLWIDSLCIKQDSVEDWERESANMGDFYRHCALNISALWARDSRDGCFSTRSALLRRPCSVNGDEQIGIFASVPETYSREGLEHDRGLLCKRGWVFQERFLSPRTLYYGAEGISWECRNGDANEETGFYTSTQKKYLRPKQELAWLENPKRWGSAPGWSRPKFDKDLSASWHIHEKWTRLVEYYTGCSLTYSSDRLVALNGIIRSIAERTGLRNVAGLWTDCIILELMWISKSAANDTPNSLPQRVSESEVYVAPSWSWASLGSQVEYIFGDSVSRKSTGAISWKGSFGLEVNIEMSLKEAVIEAKPNGQLVSAHLDVCGQIRRVNLQVFDNSNCITQDRRMMNPVEMPLPAAPPRNRWLWDHWPCRCASTEVWALLLVRNKAFVRYWQNCTRSDECMSDIGLLLERVPDTEYPPTFRRVGLFEQFHLPGDTYHLFAECKGSKTDIIRII